MDFNSVVSIPESGKESLEGWSKFPVRRPLNRPVLILQQGAIKTGSGIVCRKTGGALLCEGKKIDSNSTVWWRYL